MIEIIQAGQAGKTSSLIEMHKVRKLIFKDRMGWNIDITKDGLDIDDFDLPETVYFLVRDDKDRIAGVWRMLPTTSPSMIRKIWPDFLKEFPMPIDRNVTDYPVQPQEFFSFIMVRVLRVEEICSEIR